MTRTARPGFIGRARRAFALLTDPRTPKLPRLAVALAIGYFLWPLDLLPDFAIPVVGYLEDAIALLVSLRWLLKRGEESPPADRRLDVR